jgi:site-specific DNA-methyltransferase (adenine-specific)
VTDYNFVSGFIEAPVADITIPEFRQRAKAEPDEALVTSIRERGLLQPIILHSDLVLVAGERRLRAHIKLGRATILARIFETLTPIERYEAELQENLARKQLSWQEEVLAIGGYHKLRMEQFSGWTQMGTATALGYSTSYVSTIMAIYDDLSIGDEEVLTCPTMKGAFNLIAGRAQRAKIAAASRGLITVDQITTLIPQTPINASKEERTASLLSAMKTEQFATQTIDGLDKSIQEIKEGREAAALLEAERRREIVSDLIINADFLEWAAEYSGPKFDVLHADFPYGKGYSGPRTRKTGKVTINPQYADDPDIYFSLVDGLIQLQDRILFSAAHILFWFDMQYYQWTIDRFTEGGWSLVQPYPFIWCKGYSGIASDVKRRPRHCYETALIFARGDRKLVKLDRDYDECPLDPEKLHLTQKPISMLKKLLGLYVDEHTAVLDPTCGSGSALSAARLIGAARILGIELDENNADVAKLLLQRNLGGAIETTKSDTEQ